MDLRTLACTLFALCMSAQTVSASEECLGFPIEDGKSYEFSVSQLGTVTPISEGTRGRSKTFVLYKDWIDRSQQGASGAFDTCQMAEAFVASAKAEVEEVIDLLGGVMGMPLEIFGDLPGVDKLRDPVQDDAHPNKGSRDEILGELTLKGTQKFHGRYCAAINEITECIESSDLATYNRLKAELDAKERVHAKPMRFDAKLARDVCDLQKQMGDNPSKRGYRERTAICESAPPQ